MKILVVLLWMLIFVTPSFQDKTCSQDGCTCEKNTLRCMCDKHQNITLEPIHNTEIRDVFVNNCASVCVRVFAFYGVNLEKMEFLNIDVLNVEYFGLFGVNNLLTLKLENISEFIGSSHSFSGVENIASIIIVNVTVKELEQIFDKLSNVKNIVIKDSTFEIIKTSAFNIENVTSFNVINTNFNILESEAITLTLAKEVVFKQTFFSNVSSNSIVTTEVEHLVFEDCIFNTIDSTSICTKNLRFLDLRNCTINRLKNEAFEKIDVDKHINFISNTILSADVNSLMPNQILHNKIGNGTLTITNKDNRLVCDCNLLWLKNSNASGIYDSLINNSYCIGFSGNELPLYNVLKSEKNCPFVTEETKIAKLVEKNESSECFLEENSNSSAFELKTHSVVRQLMIMYIIFQIKYAFSL